MCNEVSSAQDPKKRASLEFIICSDVVSKPSAASGVSVKQQIFECDIYGSKALFIAASPGWENAFFFLLTVKVYLFSCSVQF